MLKKSLIALLLVAICSGPAFAHMTWGYGITTTVKWEWDKKPGPDIPVKMKVVMWARLYFKYNDPKKVVDTELILKQQANENFVDCIDLLLCCNFQKVGIGAKFQPNQTGLDTVTSKDKKAWRIAVNEGHDHDAIPGGWSDWKEKPEDVLSLDFQDPANYPLTGKEKTITICLEMRDVDPQALPYNDLKPVQIGTVFTTVQPQIAPPGYTGNNPWSQSEYVAPHAP